MPWTNALARSRRAIVTLFDPNVIAIGKVMRSTTNGFAVSIEAGCNGVEATIVLLAAILAFPAPWKHKLVGLAIGIVAVQGLNVVRVISLFYLGQWDFEVFEWAHLYVWQALIMLDVLIVWLIWVRHAAARGRRARAAGAAAPRPPALGVSVARRRSPLLPLRPVTLAWLPVAFAVWYVARAGDAVAGRQAPRARVAVARVRRPRARRRAAWARRCRSSRTLQARRRRRGGRRGHGRRQHAAVCVRPADVRGAHARRARGRAVARAARSAIVALLPFVAFGVVADFLKNVAITAGPLVASQAGFSARVSAR